MYSPRFRIIVETSQKNIPNIFYRYACTHPKDTSFASCLRGGLKRKEFAIRFFSQNHRAWLFLFSQPHCCKIIHSCLYSLFLSKTYSCVYNICIKSKLVFFIENVLVCNICIESKHLRMHNIYRHQVKTILGEVLFWGPKFTMPIWIEKPYTDEVLKSLKFKFPVRFIKISTILINKRMAIVATDKTIVCGASGDRQNHCMWVSVSKGFINPGQHIQSISMLDQ